MADANLAPASLGGDPRRWLQDGAEANGYPGAAVARLREASNSELAKVWAWLDKLESPTDRFHFVVAALRGVTGPMMRHDMRTRGKARENLRWHGQHSARYRLVAGARKGGDNSDYLRAFIGALIDFGFPLETRGAQAAIVITANVVLDQGSVTPQQVSAVLKAAGLKNA
ncbi:MAG: hypothetical protein ABI423_00625 [Burkholderiales bacterium]